MRALSARILPAILLFGMLTPALAQQSRFVRISGVSDIDTAYVYLVASSLGAPRFLLESEKSGKGAKLAARKTGMRGDTVETTDVSLQWRISISGGFYVLSSAKSGEYVTRGRNPADLSLGTDPVRWNVAGGANTFSFASTDGGDTRYLSCDTSYCYFGFYKDREFYGDLALYRSTDKAGGSVGGESGECCITAEDGGKHYAARRRAGSFMEAADVSELLLSDGSFALEDDSLRWAVSQNDDGTFVLAASGGGSIAPSGGEGGGVFGVKPVPLEEGCRFFLSEGHAATRASDGGKLYMALEPGAAGGGRRFCFVSEGAAGGLVLATLSALPAKASFTSGSGGLKTLTGGYSPDRLAQAIGEGTTSLDLRRIALPAALRDFDYAGAGNCIVYIKEEDLPRVPASWRNVVACGMSGANRLARVMRIEDGCAFRAAYPFAAGADSLLYARVFQSGWNTVCLPFKAVAVPPELQAFKFAGIDGETVNVSAAAGVEALQPYMVKLGGGSGGREAVFRAAPGTVPAAAPAEPDDGGFAGVFARLDAAEGAGLFFLAGDGGRFVSAAAGSYLDPFRCYIRYGGRVRSRVIFRVSGTAGAD